jgi:hypothetical protein
MKYKNYLTVDEQSMVTNKGKAINPFENRLIRKDLSKISFLALDRISCRLFDLDAPEEAKHRGKGRRGGKRWSARITGNKEGRKLTGVIFGRNCTEERAGRMTVRVQIIVEGLVIFHTSEEELIDFPKGDLILRIC